MENKAQTSTERLLHTQEVTGSSPVALTTSPLKIHGHFEIADPPETPDPLQTIESSTSSGSNMAAVCACRILIPDGIELCSLHDAAPELLEALKALWKRTPQIENGYCAVCRRYAHRVFTVENKEAIPGACANPQCLSYVVEIAIAKAEGRA
jgi:hypothetical protein